MLPVHNHEREIIETISANRVVVVEGPTGSGKTTQIPRIILRSGAVAGLIGVTQPRRIAAVSVARRIAEEEGVTLGQEVGYAIRFDDVTSQATELKIMTDGILLQEARSDPDFSRYGLIMIDEAHERSLNIDLTLGLLCQVLERRDDLKVVVSSATLKPEEFQAYFARAVGRVPLISILGRPYPIEIRYQSGRGDSARDLPERVADCLWGLHQRDEPGHMLAFLTGEAMVDQTARALDLLAPANGLITLPLYGRLTREEQERVFGDFGSSRKVILATNIAETSITVPGVRYVVDTGLVKLPRFDARTGITSLREEPVSRASADQRAGRAGRTGPGVVVRLYQERALARQPEYTDEEIRRLDLSEVILRLVDFGITEIEDFPFPTPPGKRAVRGALARLRALGAVDEQRRLTEVGRRMVPFPLSPPLSRMVVEASQRFPNVVDEVLLVGAFLSVRSPFLYPMGEESMAREVHADLAHTLGDAVSAVRLYRRWRNSKDPKAFCLENYLDYDNLAFIEKAHKQLADIASEHGIEVVGGGAYEDLIRAVAAGFADKVLLREGRSGRYLTTTGVKVSIHPSSALFRSRHHFLVAAELVYSSRPFARQVSVLKAEWLAEINPAAARAWRVRGSGKSAKLKIDRREPLPESVVIGPLQCAVLRRGNRAVVDIPLPLVERLRALVARGVEVPPEHARWPAQISAQQGHFAVGTALGTLVHLLASMPLPQIDAPLPILCEEGQLLDPQQLEHWKLTEELLGRLLEPMMPLDGRKPGWLTLVANGLGEFWFEVVRDYPAAVQTSLLSMEDLARVVEAQSERASGVARLMEDLVKRWQAIDEAMKRR